jgi:predicted CXXCH cytochrome family protein
MLLKLGITGIVGVVALVGLAFVLTFVISAWLGRPVVFGYNEGPTQPIAFPHERHVNVVGLDCTFCHRNVETEEAATIPSAGLCMTCHQVVDGTANPQEITKLRETVAAGRPIDWVRVHRLPDHVQFVHEAHIRYFTAQLGVESQAVCSTCHGDVTATDKVMQNRSLKMGDCVDCHRENNAPTDCTTCHY